VPAGVCVAVVNGAPSGRTHAVGLAISAPELGNEAGTDVITHGAEGGHALFVAALLAMTLFLPAGAGKLLPYRRPESYQVRI
jgi:hypothetical protein